MSFTPDHKHLILNAQVEQPLTSETAAVDWLKRLVERVGMKLVIGPMAHYCKAEDNEGIAAICAIETSHASIHVWDKVENPYLRFDLYSCKSFDVEGVLEMVKEFKPTQMEWSLFDRNFDVLEIKNGRVNTESQCSSFVCENVWDIF